MGHEDVTLVIGISALLKQARKTPSLLPLYEDIPAVNQKVGSYQTPNLLAPYLGLPSLWSCEQYISAVYDIICL